MHAGKCMDILDASCNNEDVVFTDISTVSLGLVSAPNDRETCGRCASKFFFGSRYAVHVDPNITMPRRSGAFFVNASIGNARFGFTLAGLRFKMYADYSTASPQKDSGRLLASIIERSMFRTVLCMRLAFPFDD